MGDEARVTSGITCNHCVNTIAANESICRYCGSTQRPTESSNVGKRQSQACEVIENIGTCPYCGLDQDLADIPLDTEEVKCGSCHATSNQHHWKRSLRRGTLIQHKEYGWGRVLALEGEGVSLSLTANFLDQQERVLQPFNKIAPKTTTWYERKQHTDNNKLPTVTKEPSETIEVRASGFRWLPGAFFFSGLFGGICWLCWLMLESDGSIQANSSSIFVLLSSLLLLAIGRLIELLQNIDDELFRQQRPS